MQCIVVIKQITYTLRVTQSSKLSDKVLPPAKAPAKSRGRLMASSARFLSVQNMLHGASVTRPPGSTNYPDCMIGKRKGVFMKKKESPAISERISVFCNFLDEAQKGYLYHSEQVHRLELLTQDYLHSLELDGLKYEERAKLATRLSRCRQERRQHKDMVQLLEPIVDFLESDKGKAGINQLREVLGKTRKVEKRMVERTYFPRVQEVQKKEEVHQ